MRPCFSSGDRLLLSDRGRRRGREEGKTKAPKIEPQWAPVRTGPPELKEQEVCLLAARALPRAVARREGQGWAIEVQRTLCSLRPLNSM
eukprot:5106210-Pyramimonas_sp.AAC.1